MAYNRWVEFKEEMLARRRVHFILDGDFEAFDKRFKSRQMRLDIGAALSIDPSRVRIGECTAGSVLAEVSSLEIPFHAASARPHCMKRACHALGPMCLGGL